MIDCNVPEQRAVRAAFYARVSSEQQASAGTIGSQLAALEARAAADQVKIGASMRFVDEAVSGSTLVRPALEKLRDLASADGIDRLYVLCPDRLARKHSHQMLLIEELEHCGVELVFLDHESRHTPEDKLLVQIQGVVAEYERTKIIERCRRGKLHAARRGAINVLGGAPFGYRYVPAVPGAAPAQYTIVLEQAAVVRQIFQWVGIERHSIGQVCKRLQNLGILSPRGRQRWDRSSVWALLKNPAYSGKAAFGKTRLGPMRPRLRGARGRPDQPRSGKSVYDTPAQQWIDIAVPAIVEQELFDAVSEQLAENQKRSRQRRNNATHLLAGLLVCKRCHYAFYAKGNARNPSHGCYRCSGTEAHRFGGQRLCDNKPVNEAALDQAVWNDVRALLADPQRIEQEMNRRLDSPTQTPEEQPGKKPQSQIDRLHRALARLIDAYSDGLLDKSDFEPRVKSTRAQLSQLTAQLQSQEDQQQRARELRGIVDHLQTFSHQVNNGLNEASWQTKQELIRTLVKRIEIDNEQINVIYRVDLCPFEPGPIRGTRQYCRRSGRSTSVRAFPFVPSARQPLYLCSLTPYFAHRCSSDFHADCWHCCN